MAGSVNIHWRQLLIHANKTTKNRKPMKVAEALFLLLILHLVSINPLSAQQVPNGDFENWTGSGNYQDPVSWSTPNSTTASLSTYTVTKETTIKQSGTASAKVQTKSVLGFKIPGLMTLGTFSINLVTMEAKIEGGTPFTGRPNALTGYLQYEPKLGDEGFIGVLLLKQNGTAWDTIGSGSYSTTSTLLTWTPFTVNIDYSHPDNPTHLNIIILSSDQNNPQPNSTLYIDNLQFQYPIGLSDQTADQAPEMYASNGRIFIQNLPESWGETYVDVFSLDGKLVFRDAITQGELMYSAPLPESAPSGLYIVRVRSTNGNVVTGKVVKK
jgi:hypothetical protein